MGMTVSVSIVIRRKMQRRNIKFCAALELKKSTPTIYPTQKISYTKDISEHRKVSSIHICIEMIFVISLEFST